MSGRLFIGTSGWNYRHWGDGIFYPRGLGQKNWLSYYVQSFDSVEINNSFYRLPEKHVFEGWYKSVPDQFTFAVKANRFITHLKKLADPQKHLPLFLENASGLEEKLGVMLFQLPPFWKFNPGRLKEFCDSLYRQKIIPGLRSALEVRHPSWHVDACFEILREYNICLALADWPGLSVQGPLTANFVFIRRHGPESLYASNYSDSSLRIDAKKIRTWLAESKDVFAYFNNDAFGYAVKNALRLKELLGKSFDQ